MVRNYRRCQRLEALNAENRRHPLRELSWHVDDDGGWVFRGRSHQRTTEKDPPFTEECARTTLAVRGLNAGPSDWRWYLLRLRNGVCS
jgi:hypothetical protein